MDWHAAKAFHKTQKGDVAVKLSEEQFDQLADDSYQKILGVKRAAKRYLRDRDRQQMEAAIDGMDLVRARGGTSATTGAFNPS